MLSITIIVSHSTGRVLKLVGVIYAEERGLTESRIATTSRNKEIRNLCHSLLDNSIAQEVSRAIIVRISTTPHIRRRSITCIFTDQTAE